MKYAFVVVALFGGLFSLAHFENDLDVSESIFVLLTALWTLLCVVTYALFTQLDRVKERDKSIQARDHLLGARERLPLVMPGMFLNFALAHPEDGRNLLRLLAKIGCDRGSLASLQQAVAAEHRSVIGELQRVVRQQEVNLEEMRVAAVRQQLVEETGIATADFVDSLFPPSSAAGASSGSAR